MHSMHLAAHLVQHLPAVCPELFLNSRCKVLAALLEEPDIVITGVPSVVPALEVVQQLSRQPVTPGPDALLLWPGCRATPSSGWRSRSFFFLLGQDPPDPVSAIVPVDEDSAWLGHIARS
jgi:hypothetical protein